MQICCKNFKPNIDKCYFRCIRDPIFGKIISRYGVQSDPSKLHVLIDKPPPTNKKELQPLLGIMNYLAKFSLAIPERMMYV